MYPESSVDNGYKKQEEAFAKALSKASKKSGSELLKKVSVEVEKRNDQESKDRCRMAYMVFDEALDEYKEGEMEWKEVVEDLHKALKSI